MNFVDKNVTIIKIISDIEENMEVILRKYRPEDFEDIAKLFYQTVHSINARDYSPCQLDAWAKDLHSLDRRQEDFANQNSWIALIDDEIAGFGSIDGSYLDMLYVSKDRQRCKVATALCDEMEKGLDKITTHASITAKDFFLKRGYVVIRQQNVLRDGVALTNFEMQKTL